MRFTRSLTLMVVAGCCMIGARVAAEKNQPELQVSETSFDFGHVPQGMSISHIFWLKNIGGDTLLIQNVKPG